MNHARRTQFIVSIVVAALAARAFSQGTTTRVSVSSTGAQANADCTYPSMSADGRFIAFESQATNLTGANNGKDIFVHDRQTGVTTRASVNSAGNGSAGQSQHASISADGRFVAFDGTSDLAPGSSPYMNEVYVRDLVNAKTTLVSVTFTGAYATGNSLNPSISADGRFIAFESYATNLVAGGSIGYGQIHVRDLVAATTEIVSLDTNGQLATDNNYEPVISGDGRFVAFKSRASLTPASTNLTEDVYVRDRLNGTTSWVSHALGGGQPNGSSGNPSISADGAWIAFFSFASNLTLGDNNGMLDSFLYETASGALQRLDLGIADAQSNGQVSVNSLSADGRFVGLYAFATNIVPVDMNAQPDALVYDRVSDGTILASRATSGAQGNGNSAWVRVSDDGRVAAFMSLSTNLVSGDTNGNWDIFVHERIGSTPASYCTAKVNSLGCVPAMSFSGTPSVSSLAPFDVRATNVLCSEPGIFFYGFAPVALPFQGGVRCVQYPVVRTPLQNSGGSFPPGSDCSGTYSFDFNARIRSGIDPRLVVGTVVYGQHWSRDPASPSTTGVTDALAFTIEP